VPDPDVCASEESRALEFARNIRGISEILDAIDYPMPFADEFNQGGIWEDAAPDSQWRLVDSLDLD
jgi:hypothetical protein